MISLGKSRISYTYQLHLSASEAVCSLEQTLWYTGFLPKYRKASPKGLKLNHKAIRRKPRQDMISYDSSTELSP